VRFAQCFELDPVKGVLGPTLAKKRPKTDLNYYKHIISPRGLTATRFCIADHLASRFVPVEVAGGSNSFLKTPLGLLDSHDFAIQDGLHQLCFGHSGLLPGLPGLNPLRSIRLSCLTD
jgi:hypothetical protein